MTRRLVLLLLLAALVTACGTRRTDADFVALGASRGTSADPASAGTDQGTGGGPGAQAAAAAPGSSDGLAAGAGSPGSGGTVEPVAGTAGGGSAPRAGGAAGVGPAGAPAPGTTAASGRGDAPGGGAVPATGGGASDVGVTARSIEVGNVVSYKGLAGPDQFPPYYYGAAAYFNDLNSRGGINGRKVVFSTCDDAFTSSGDVKCVRDLVDKQEVFAFVANGCGICDGFPYAADKGVPSLNGLTTDFRGYALKHTWNSLGNPYPQNGKIGWKGKIYNGSAIYGFFKKKYGITKAGIVYYENAAPSKNSALSTAALMKAEGITPYLYGLNVALPQYDSAVIDMKSRGVTGVWDAIDITGNQNLCKSIDSNGLELTAKVSTSAGWTQKVGKTYSSPCRNAIFTAELPGSTPFTRTADPEVAMFRAAYDRFFPQRKDDMHQWSLDGWALAMQFTEAAKACGAQLTRVCLEKNLDAKPYTAHGLWQARGNEKIDFDRQKTKLECLSIARWSDAARTWQEVARWEDTCVQSRLIGQQQG